MYHIEAFLFKRKVKKEQPKIYLPFLFTSDSSISCSKINKGINVCVFPEGTVPSPEIELGEFKQGAFSIAIEHQIPIVIFTFLDNKKRFPWSFGNLLSGSKGMPGELRVITHDPISTKNLAMSDMKDLSDKVRNIMLKDLAES